VDLFLRKKLDFHPSFPHIIKELITRVPNTPENKIVFVLKNLFFQATEKVTVHSLQHLKELTKGRPIIYLSPVIDNTNFEIISKDEKQFSLIEGVYFTSFAYSILAQNKIQCIILDTTFRLLPHYVSSFLFIVIQNVGIPIGMSFTKTELKRTYQLFYENFYKYHRYNLKIHPVLSDQGSALISFCTEEQISQYFCQWHLLHKMGLKQFTFDVSLIIKASTEKELTKVKSILENVWSNICTDEAKFQKLNKNLKKIGLTFSENKITEINVPLWHQFSTIPRVTNKIPTTTSFIENTHGHCNGKLPRNNKIFYGNILIDSIYSIQDSTP
jgi:hypothetical protein